MDRADNRPLLMPGQIHHYVWTDIWSTCYLKPDIQYPTGIH